MQAPIQSTITLIVEIVIAVIIFFIIYRAYVQNVFMRRLAFFAIAYETIFNIGYMVFRSMHPSSGILTTSMKMVGAMHGILSLVIFIAVIVIFLKANKANKMGENYFKKHFVVTFLFILGWIISLLSGSWLYWASYYR